MSREQSLIVEFARFDQMSNFMFKSCRFLSSLLLFKLTTVLFVLLACNGCHPSGDGIFEDAKDVFSALEKHQADPTYDKFLKGRLEKGHLDGLMNLHHLCGSYLENYGDVQYMGIPVREMMEVWIWDEAFSVVLQDKEGLFSSPKAIAKYKSEAYNQPIGQEFYELIAKQDTSIRSKAIADARKQFESNPEVSKIYSASDSLTAYLRNREKPELPQEEKKSMMSAGVALVCLPIDFEVGMYGGKSESIVVFSIINDIGRKGFNRAIQGLWEFSE